MKIYNLSIWIFTIIVGLFATSHQADTRGAPQWKDGIWLPMSEANSNLLPLVHGGSSQFQELLEAISAEGTDADSAVSGQRPIEAKMSIPTVKMPASEMAGFFVISDTVELAVERLKMLFGTLGAIPFIPGITNPGENTVFVSVFDSFVFFIGDGISPIAATLSASGEAINSIHPALDLEGGLFPPGPLAGPFNRLEIGTAEVFVLTRDPEGRGMVESQRPRPRRQTLIAWDGDLAQLPALSFDEMGVGGDRFWIQRNIDSFEVPAGRDMPFFSTSFHCPHYVYQYSFVNPQTGEPSILMERLEFTAEGSTVRPVRVVLDVESAAGLSGPSISCRVFSTVDDILGGRFGHYQGEQKTKWGEESESGESYLAISKEFSAKYLDKIQRTVESMDSSSVVVSARLGKMFESSQSVPFKRGIASDVEVVEMGGTVPGHYLSSVPLR